MLRWAMTMMPGTTESALIHSVRLVELGDSHRASDEGVRDRERHRDLDRIARVRRRP